VVAPPTSPDPAPKAKKSFSSKPKVPRRRKIGERVLEDPRLARTQKKYEERKENEFRAKNNYLFNVSPW
jgi:hypothetical protein